jgi:hypothetical protein
MRSVMLDTGRAANAWAGFSGLGAYLRARPSCRVRRRGAVMVHAPMSKLPKAPHKSEPTTESNRLTPSKIDALRECARRMSAKQKASKIPRAAGSVFG